MTTIKYYDFAGRGNLRVNAPQKIVIELRRRRLLERHRADAHRAHAAHHVPDRAVFSRCVHTLQHDQHFVAMLGVEKLLKLAEALDELAADLVAFVLVARRGARVVGIEVSEADFVAGLHS